MRGSSLFIALVFAVALAARLWSLASHSLLLDEAFVAVGARDMLRNGTPMWDAISNAPFVWLIGHTLGLAGLASPFLVRLPSAVIGGLSVIPLYLLARRLFGETTARAAATLFALHPLSVALSRVLFADPFQVFFVICGWLAFDSALADRARPVARDIVITILIWAVAFIMKYNAVVPGTAWLLAGILAERYSLRNALSLGIAMLAGSAVTLIVWPHDATIWLAAFLEKGGSYDLGYSAFYYWSKLHLVLFALSEVAIVTGVATAFSRRTSFAHALRHIVSFLLIFIVTVIVLGRTFERYLLASVPAACMLLAALGVMLYDHARNSEQNKTYYRVGLLAFAALIVLGYSRSYAHYIHYLGNNTDHHALATSVAELERQGHRGFWLMSEPVGAYYLGFSQHYSRSAGVQAHDSLASDNYFEFSGVPYSQETSEYKVLTARRLASAWGMGRILSAPSRFLHAVDSIHALASAHQTPFADYFTSDLVRPGDALIMQGGTSDLLGEPILERFDTTKLPPTFGRLPLERFRIYKTFGTTADDTTIERMTAKAWILIRK